MSNACNVIIFSVLGAVFLIFFLKALLNLMRKKLLKRVEERFNSGEIVLSAFEANFLGQSSRGLKQMRGNGALVLTAEGLWFCFLAPAREFYIPLKNITSVQLKKSHLKKTFFRDLLYVETEDSGIRDSFGWFVKDPGKWMSVIEKFKKGQKISG